VPQPEEGILQLQPGEFPQLGDITLTITGGLEDLLS
jgi:hypothetical protein